MKRKIILSIFIVFISLSFALCGGLFFILNDVNEPVEETPIETPQEGNEDIETQKTNFDFTIIPIVWVSSTSYETVSASSNHVNKPDKYASFDTEWRSEKDNSENFSADSHTYYAARGYSASYDDTNYNNLKYLDYNYSHTFNYQACLKVTMYDTSAVDYGSDWRMMCCGASADSISNSTNQTYSLGSTTVYLYNNSSNSHLVSSSHPGNSCHYYLCGTYYLIYRWKYKVTFSDSYSGFSKTVDSVAGLTYTIPTMTGTRTGYTFKGWTGSGLSVLASTTTMAAANSHIETWTAAWQANTYTVTLDANGGTIDITYGPELKTYGAPYGELPTPTRTGYTFDGWYTNKNYTTRITSSSTVTTARDHTLYAKWIANNYTVTFDANGGSVSYTSQDVTYDSTYGTLPTPTRTGYTFNGWAGNMIVSHAATVTNSTSYCFFSSSLTEDLQSYTTYAFVTEIKLSQVPTSGDNWVGIWLDGGYSASVARKNDVGTSWVTWRGTFTTGDVSTYTHGGKKVIHLYNGPSEQSASKPISMNYFALYKLSDATNIASSPSTSSAIVTSSSTVMTASNHTLYASWTQNTYVVDFDTPNYYGKFTGPYFNAMSGSYSSSVSGGIKETIVTFSAASTSSGSGFWVTASQAPAAGTYKWSIDIKSSSAVTIKMGKEGSSGYLNANLTTSYQTFTCQFTTTSTLNQAFTFYSPNYVSGMTVSFKNLTMQKIVDLDTSNYYGNFAGPHFYLMNGSHTSSVSDGIKETVVSFSAASTSSASGFWVTASQAPVAGTYKWSIDIKASSAVTIKMGKEGSSGYLNANLTTSYQTFTCQFTTTSTLNQAFTFYSPNYVSGMTVSFKNLTMQKVFEMKADNALPSRTIVYDSTVSTLPVATRAGWTFGGWYHRYDFTSTCETISSYNTYRFYESGKSYGGNTLKVGDRVFMLITFNSTSGLQSVDVNDVGLTKNREYVVNGNTVTINYTVTSSQYVGTYSFVDFVFNDSNRTYTLGEFYFILQYGNASGTMTRSLNFVDCMLYSYWIPLEASVNVSFKWTNTLEGTSETTTTASGFSYTLIYETTTLGIETGAPTTAYKIVTPSDTGALKGVRQYQTLRVQDIVAPDGWICLACEYYTGGTWSSFGWSGPFTSGTTRNIGDSINIVFYFKVASDNRLKYDSVDKYFYFEDGEFPQTAVSTYNTSFNTLLTNIYSSSTGTSFISNGITFYIQTYTYSNGEDSSFAGYSGQRFLGFVMPTTRNISFRKDTASTRIFTAGTTYWFRYDPIRWRVSDYGVASTSPPSDWNAYASGKTNFNVVSDVLWWDVLNSSSNNLGVGDNAMQTTFSQALSNGALFGGMDFEYLAEGKAYEIDEFNTSSSNKKVLTTTNGAVKMRYVRFSSNGSSANAYNHISKVKVKLANGTEKILIDAPNSIFNSKTSTPTGSGESAYYAYSGQSLDLGSVCSVSSINLRRYYPDARKYYGQKVEYSVDGTTWYTYWDSYNKGAYGSNDNTNLYAESSDGRWFTLGAMRVASVSEVEKYQSELGSYGSQLACVIAGVDQNKFLEYWTRDFGQQMGCGTYVTKSGSVLKNSYWDTQKGVRFSIVMTEGSFLGV